MQIGAIKDAVDAFIAENKDQLKRRQAQYLAKHGRYWQGPLTPVVPPDDGALAAPDLSRAVLRSSWGHVLKGADAWPATWPCSCRVDASNGPGGHAYTLTVFVTKNGKTHTRTRDFLGTNDTAWSQVPDAIVPPTPTEEEDLP